MTYWGTKILLNLKNTVDLTMHVIKISVDRNSRATSACNTYM